MHILNIGGFASVNLANVNYSEWITPTNGEPKWLLVVTIHPVQDEQSIRFNESDGNRFLFQLSQANRIEKGVAEE